MNVQTIFNRIIKSRGPKFSSLKSLIIIITYLKIQKFVDIVSITTMNQGYGNRRKYILSLNI